MLDSKKNLLCFGASSYLAGVFLDRFGSMYNILKVGRKETDSFYCDFENEESVESFADKINLPLDGIIFFQGLNPSHSFADLTYEHFYLMMNIHVIAPSILLKGLSRRMNDECSVLFFSSIAKQKGSYDPCYASAKSALNGLIQSLANCCPKQRFNIITLGLVQNSPVHQGMSADFIEKHSSRMFKNRLVDAASVASMIDEVLNNKSLNRADLNLDGGYA